MEPAAVLVLVTCGILLLVMLLFAVFMVSLLRPWLQSLMAGAGVSIIQILGMRLRGCPPSLVIDTFLVLKHRGIVASIADVERVYLANKGQVDNPSRLAGMVEERLRRQAEVTQSS